MASGFRDFVGRADLLRQSKQAFRRTKDDLLSEFMIRRYPVIVQLTDDAIVRVEQPDHYLDKATGLRSQFRLAESKTVLEQGLARHLNSPKLWHILMEVRFDLSDVAGKSDFKEFNDMLLMLRTMNAEAPGLGSIQYYWEGQIREKLGQYDKAIEAYQIAVEKASSPEDRIRATSRLLQAQLQRIPKDGKGT